MLLGHETLIAVSVSALTVLSMVSVFIAFTSGGFSLAKWWKYGERYLEWNRRVIRPRYDDRKMLELLTARRKMKEWRSRVPQGYYTIENPVSLKSLKDEVARLEDKLFHGG